MKTKKGYYYVLDVTLAVIIIIIGFMLIISKLSYEPEKLYTHQVSKDLLSILQDVKLTDVCLDFNTCTCSYDTLTALCLNGEIENEKISLLEYLGELYSKNMQPEAAGIIEEIFVTKKILPENYDFVVLISDASNVSEVAQLYPLIT